MQEETSPCGFRQQRRSVPILTLTLVLISPTVYSAPAHDVSLEAMAPHIPLKACYIT